MRIVLWITCFVFVFLVPQAALAKKKYVVKMRAGGSRNPLTRMLVRSRGLKALDSEIQSFRAVKSKTQKLENLGVLLVQSENDSVRELLEDHPMVEYFEEEKSWKVSASSDLPSSQYRSPWLSDVLGLQKDTVSPNVENTKTAVKIAVIDTGANLYHPYLVAGWSVNSAEVNGAPGVDDDNNGYIDDKFGANPILKNGDVSEIGTDHGTHVSGIIKAIRDQAIPLYTEARAVEIIPIRFIDSRGVGSTSSAVLAMEYAAMSGAKVVNCSWGAKGEEAFSRILYDSMVDLYKRDILIVTAAGNADSSGPNDNDSIPYFPSSFNIPSLMSVASITPYYSNGRYQGASFSSFSNYGNFSVDIAAPGSYRTDFARGIWSANAHFSSAYNYFIRKRGTSMAAPVVAGIAGVVRAINPRLTAYEVKELIADTSNVDQSANKIGSRSVVDADAAFRSAVYAKTKGLKPPVDSSPYRQAASRSTASDNRGGGCASVSPISGGGGGGNSLLPVLGSMLLMAYFRRNRRRKSRQPRV